MYNIYVRCNYKLTLWFKSKALNKKHKNIKLSTKIKNLIKTCTYHKKDFRICISFEKQAKLTCTEKLRHNDFNKFKFQLKVSYT